MTSDADLLAIRNTMAAYNLAGDRMRIAELAATFAEDGVLKTPTATLTGRAAIIEGLGGGDKAAPAPSGPRPSFVRHHLTTSGVQLTGPDTADGRTYFIVFTDIGPDHAGVYVDRLRKVCGQWLFAHRDVRIDWMSEQTLFAGQQAAYLARKSAAAAARAQVV